MRNLWRFSATEMPPLTELHHHHPPIGFNSLSVRLVGGVGRIRQETTIAARRIQQDRGIIRVAARRRLIDRSTLIGTQSSLVLQFGEVHIVLLQDAGRLRIRIIDVDQDGALIVLDELLRQRHPHHGPN